MRLINAGKTSKVFETAGGEEDEHEDDYIESREFFAKWDGQRLAEEQRAKDERDKEHKEHLERAAEYVRQQETKRIFEQARKHLMEEMSIKLKAEQKAAKAEAALAAAKVSDEATEIAREAIDRNADTESVSFELHELIVSDDVADCDEDEQQMEVADYEERDDDLDEATSYEVIEVEECDVKNENFDKDELIEQPYDDENFADDSNEEEYAIDEEKSGKFYVLYSNFVNK